MLVGACFRSIPQILRILRAKSATGVSLSANIAELLAYSITVAYNSRNGAIMMHVRFGHHAPCSAALTALPRILASHLL